MFSGVKSSYGPLPGVRGAEPPPSDELAVVPLATANPWNLIRAVSSLLHFGHGATSSRCATFRINSNV